MMPVRKVEDYFFFDSAKKKSAPGMDGIPFEYFNWKVNKIRHFSKSAEGAVREQGRKEKTAEASHNIGQIIYQISSVCFVWVEGEGKGAHMQSPRRP